VSHAGYLREAWDGDDDALLAWLKRWVALGRAAADLTPRQLRDRVARLDMAPLDEVDGAIARFAGTLAGCPGSHTRDDVTALRAVGLDDREIHDVVNVVGCFAYMNRLADGLGVGIEPRKVSLARALMGDEATEAHLAWARV
jgi:uncharacterized protein YciW